MVQSFNKKKRTTIVELNGDIEDLCNTQNAIIELLRNYDYDNYGDMCKEAVSTALDLLSDLLPDCETQKRGFEMQDEYITLPKELSDESKETLREALYQIENKGVTVREKPNPIYNLLTK